MSEITGMVRLTLADLHADLPTRLETGIPVTVDIGDGWPDYRDLSALRLLAWRADGALTVVGSDPSGVRYAVDYLRRQAEAEQAAAAS